MLGSKHDVRSQNIRTRAGKMGWRLRTLAALPEGPGSITSIYVAAQSAITPGLGGLMSSFGIFVHQVHKYWQRMAKH